jgi:hypothetical protein
MWELKYIYIEKKKNDLFLTFFFKKKVRQRKYYLYKFALSKFERSNRIKAESSEFTRNGSESRVRTNVGA